MKPGSAGRWALAVEPASARDIVIATRELLQERTELFWQGLVNNRPVGGPKFKSELQQHEKRPGSHYHK